MDLALQPVGGHEVGIPGSCPGPQLPVRPTWPGTGCAPHCPSDKTLTGAPWKVGPRAQGAQTKKAEPSWWEVSIPKAKDLLPKGLRFPKVDGAPPLGSWP